MNKKKKMCSSFYSLKRIQDIFKYILKVQIYTYIFKNYAYLKIHVISKINVIILYYTY